MAMRKLQDTNVVVTYILNHIRCVYLIQAISSFVKVTQILRKSKAKLITLWAVITRETNIGLCHSTIMMRMVMMIIIMMIFIMLTKRKRRRTVGV